MLGNELIGTRKIVVPVFIFHQTWWKNRGKNGYDHDKHDLMVWDHQKCISDKIYTPRSIFHELFKNHNHFQKSAWILMILVFFELVWTMHGYRTGLMYTTHQIGLRVALVVIKVDDHIRFDILIESHYCSPWDRRWSCWILARHPLRHPTAPLTAPHRFSEQMLWKYRATTVKCILFIRYMDSVDNVYRYTTVGTGCDLSRWDFGWPRFQV